MGRIGWQQSVFEDGDRQVSANLSAIVVMMGQLLLVIHCSWLIFRLSSPLAFTAARASLALCVWLVCRSQMDKDMGMSARRPFHVRNASARFKGHLIHPVFNHSKENSKQK